MDGMSHPNGCVCRMISYIAHKMCRRKPNVRTNRIHFHSLSIHCSPHEFGKQRWTEFMSHASICFYGIINENQRCVMSRRYYAIYANVRSHRYLHGTKTQKKKNNIQYIQHCTVNRRAIALIFVEIDWKFNLAYDECFVCAFANGELIRLSQQQTNAMTKKDQYNAGGLQFTDGSFGVANRVVREPKIRNYIKHTGKMDSVQQM